MHPALKRLRPWLLAFGFAFLAAGAAKAQSELNTKCEADDMPPLEQIAACTAVLNQPGADRAAAYTNRGRAELHLKNYKAALEDENRALELREDYPSFLDRGDAYYYLNDYVRAIDDFTKAIALDSTKSEAYLNRCDSYRLTKEFGKALRDAQSALNDDPKGNASFLMGRVYADMNFDRLAIEAFTDAISKNDRDPHYYLQRCASYLSAGDRVHEIADLNRAIELGNREPAPWNLLGSAYEHEHAFSSALSTFERALSFAPDNESLLRGACGEYAAFGQVEDALRTCRKALHANPSNAVALGNIALADYKAGKYAEAFEYAGRALSVDPADAEVWAIRSFVERRKGRTRAADADLAKARENDKTLEQDLPEDGLRIDGSVFTPPESLYVTKPLWVGTLPYQPVPVSEVIFSDGGVLRKAGTYSLAGWTLAPVSDGSDYFRGSDNARQNPNALDSWAFIGGLRCTGTSEPSGADCAITMHYAVSGETLCKLAVGHHDGVPIDCPRDVIIDSASVVPPWATMKILENVPTFTMLMRDGLELRSDQDMHLFDWTVRSTPKTSLSRDKDSIFIFPMTCSNGSLSGECSMSLRMDHTYKSQQCFLILPPDDRRSDFNCPLTITQNP